MWVEGVDIKAINKVQVNVASAIIIAGKSERPPNITSNKKVVKNWSLKITSIKLTKSKKVIWWAIRIRTKK